jgi:quercetin dioxygenase-like cupin family protein
MFPRRLIALFVSVVVLQACGDGGGIPDGGINDGGMDNGGMDEGALGASAKTTVLAEATVDLPEGPLAWTAFTVSEVKHEHADAFVHAQGSTTVTIDGESTQLADGEAMFVPAGTRHRHGSGSAWDVVLDNPDVEAPSEPVFRSDSLEGLPDGEALLRAILVELPPDTQTSIHTHPGPEFVYVTRGPFAYENAIIGEVEAHDGDTHTAPAGTPVQKRNPDGADTGAFLSWFVVEPDEPFAPEASFGE